MEFIKELSMKPIPVVVALLVVCSSACAPTEEAPAQDQAGGQETVHGAWRIIESWGQNPRRGEWRTTNVQPSVFLFADGYYSIAYVDGDEKRPLMPEDAYREDLTPEQAASVWIPYISNSGTYELTPSTLTTQRIVAVWPNGMEEPSRTYTYRLDGDTLELSSSGDDWTWNARLQRLQ